MNNKPDCGACYWDRVTRLCIPEWKMKTTLTGVCRVSMNNYAVNGKLTARWEEEEEEETEDAIKL